MSGSTLASNTRAERSPLPVATRVPSGLNATARTMPSWSRRASSAPVAASNTRAERSPLPVATRVPSGLNATARTMPPWSRRARVAGWIRRTCRSARPPCAVGMVRRDSVLSASAIVNGGRAVRSANSASAARRKASARCCAFWARSWAVSARSRASRSSRRLASAAVSLRWTNLLTEAGISAGRVVSHCRASAIRSSGSGSPSAAPTRAK